MKIFKKVSSVFTALFCAMALMVSGVVVYAETDEETLESTMIMTAEGLTDAIIPLTDEDIANYMNSADAFTAGAMTSWTAAKEELGEKTEEEAGETEISYANKEYTVTVPVAFEKADANFVYLFEEDGTPVSLSVDVQYPMSVTLQRAGMNTLMGIGTVFLMLVFLSFVISLFKLIPGLVEGNKKAAPAQNTSAPAPVAAAPVVEEDVIDDGELIAVIAAAIAASEGTSTDGFVVRSIRKVKRNKR